MLTTLALASLLAGQPGGDVAPILFDTITPKVVASLHGQRVTITFTPAKPAYTWGERKELLRRINRIAAHQDKTVPKR